MIPETYAYITGIINNPEISHGTHKTLLWNSPTYRNEKE